MSDKATNRTYRLTASCDSVYYILHPLDVCVDVIDNKLFLQIRKYMNIHKDFRFLIFFGFPLNI